MIHEVATLTIDPAHAADFEAAVAEAVPLFQEAAGFLTFRLEQVIETPGQYHLVVGWQSVAHHMELFRESDNFQAWRKLVGPYLSEPPSVVHTQEVRIGEL